MSDPVTQPTPPDALPPVGQGREYRFAELVAAAWRNFRRTWGRSLWYMALAVTVLWIVGDGLTWLFGRTPFYTGGAAYWARTGIIFLWLATLEVMLQNSYGWAIVRAYDRPKMRFADMLRPWRRPWVGPMLLLSLLLGLAFAATFTASLYGAYVAMGALYRRTSSDTASLLGWIVVAEIPRYMIAAAILFATMLAGGIILADQRPRLASALRRNLQILRGQPWRIAAMVGLWASGLLTLDIASDIVTVSLPPSSPWVFTAIDMTRGALMIGWEMAYVHLVAAVFRAAYGWPLEGPQEPGADTPPARPDEGFIA